MMVDLRAMLSRATVRRLDWPHRIGTPRLVVGLIGATSTAAGVALTFGTAQHSSGPTFYELNRTGVDLGFHARPALPFGVLCLVTGLLVLIGLWRLWPFVAGFGMAGQAALLAAYTVGAWRATTLPPRIQIDHLGHVLTPSQASYFAAILLTERTIWLIATSGALLSITSSDPVIDPWPWH